MSFVDTSESISHLAPVWGRSWEVVADHGEGTYVWDVEGSRYLDFTSGIGVTNTGHCHPAVVSAAQDQVARIIHAQANIFYSKPMLRLVDALREVVPERLDSFFFANSGAEAVEAAIKLARAATGRTNVIAFEGSFHGRTIGAMSLTSSKAVYRAGYQPLMAGVFFAPYSNPFTCPKAVAAPETHDCTVACSWPLERIREMLLTQTSPEETAAILVEPVQGEGGYVVPTPEFMVGLREICDEHGILLIHDEIQTGAGRTGRFFAGEHFGVVPDILIMAKGIASGFPVSAIAAPRELMGRWKVGAHGGTFGGNAVSCAASEATIRVLREEGLVENAARMGEMLIERLRFLQARHSFIGDVRGLGLMVGVEFVKPGTRKPAPELAKRVQKACFEGKLLLLACGRESQVIRWIPPLTVTSSELEEGLAIFEHALDSVEAATVGGDIALI